MRILGIPRLVLISLIGLSVPASASPPVPTRTSPGVVAPFDKVPTDARRTTLIVHDIDTSLKLYRDVLGMKMNYDAVVTMGGIALPADKPGDKARLVLLNGNDAWLGWIGFLQWIEPTLEPVPPYAKRMTYGGTVLVVNTDVVEGRCAAASRVPGVTVIATVFRRGSLKGSGATR